MISILAVLADRDFPFPHSVSRMFHFNPRGPCGPRLLAVVSSVLTSLFQSSRSLRTATVSKLPLMESAFYFNPRGPCGPRQVQGHHHGASSTFQSSRSLRTATRIDKSIKPFAIFQSSRSLRTATAKTHKRSAASLYKAENILSAPKSFLREGRKNQRLPSPSPCVFRCEPARERPGAWPSH